ncbi:MAG: hypothetical protein US70_C0023G0013 [Parcubacteria group bacterium GW2011_GWD2_38_11]|nr:MAG: hypothetical protein US70_C0023G0013 [Parcubacteria group bacterium GW2011_GWD2_38_11]
MFFLKERFQPKADQPLAEILRFPTINLPINLFLVSFRIKSGIYADPESSSE